MQAKIPNGLLGAAVAAGLLLSVPGVASADSGKDDKKSYDPNVVTVCKKKEFFNKIHFKVKANYGSPYDQHYDVIVKHEPEKPLDLMKTVNEKFGKDMHSIEILDVSLSVVCVVFKEVPQGHKYDNND